MVTRKQYGKWTVVPAYLGSWRVLELPQYKVRRSSTCSRPCYAVDKVVDGLRTEIGRTSGEWYGKQDENILAALVIIEADLEGKENG